MGTEPFKRMWWRGPEFITQHLFFSSSPYQQPNLLPGDKRAQVNNCSSHPVSLQVTWCLMSWKFSAFLTASLSDGAQISSCPLQEPWQWKSSAKEAIANRQRSLGLWYSLWSHHIESWVSISGMIQDEYFHTMTSLKLGWDLQLIVF